MFMCILVEVSDADFETMTQFSTIFFYENKKINTKERQTKPIWVVICQDRKVAWFKQMHKWRPLIFNKSITCALCPTNKKIQGSSVL